MKGIMFTQHFRLNKYIYIGVRDDKHSFLFFVSFLFPPTFANKVRRFAASCEMFLKSSKTLMRIADHSSSTFLNKNTVVFCITHYSLSTHQSLCSIEEFRNLDRDIEGSAKRWKKFVESECPEKEKFPQEWKNKTSLQRLCMMRALRPDRMTYAVR